MDWRRVKLWKMVDAKHADSVARGTLRIGALLGFGDLKNGRADTLDGGFRVRFDTIASDLSDPGDADMLRRQGLNVRPGEGSGKAFVWAEGNSEETQFRNCWAFCTTVPGNTHDSNPGEPKAIFEIADAAALYAVLNNCLPPEVVSVTLGFVKYEPRDLPESERGEPHLFVKAPKYAPEEEVRYLLTGLPGRVTEPLWVRENPEVARLLRRLSPDEIASAAASYVPAVRRVVDFLPKR